MEMPLKILTIMNTKTLIVVLGPTAIGKTALCIHLAKHYNTEIISADSRQFYKELRIGSCAPNKKELSQIKHHLIHHLSIHETYNVFQFEKDALIYGYNLDNLCQNYKSIPPSAKSVGELALQNYDEWMEKNDFL